MELTEKERFMLIEKKEQIFQLTREILDSLDQNDKATEVKRNMTNILSLLSTIASYADSKNYNLNNLVEGTNRIFAQINLLGDQWTTFSPIIELYCNAFNSIQFNFTKKDFKIRIPKFDVSLFRIEK